MYICYLNILLYVRTDPLLSNVSTRRVYHVIAHVVSTQAGGPQDIQDTAAVHGRRDGLQTQYDKVEPTGTCESESEITSHDKPLSHLRLDALTTAVVDVAIR